MKYIKLFEDYTKLNEDGEGGGSVGAGGGSGTACATLGQNGMGNIVAPQVGTITGSVWQNGSGTIGSGDRPAYDTGKKFDKLDDEKGNRKGKKGKGKNKPNVIMKYSQFLMGPNKNLK